MALDAVFSDSPTTINDRRAASVQHGGEVQPRGGCDASSRTSGARAAEASGSTHAAQMESGSTHGVRAAHLKATQRGAARRLFAEADMNAVSTLTVQRIRGGENTRHTHCNTMRVSGPGRGDRSDQSYRGGPPLRMQDLGRASQLLSSSPPRAVRGVSTSKILLRRCAPGGSTSCFSAWPCGVAAAA